jgi:hypothetical protein
MYYNYDKYAYEVPREGNATTNIYVRLNSLESIFCKKYFLVLWFIEYVLCSRYPIWALYTITDSHNHTQRETFLFLIYKSENWSSVNLNELVMSI